MGTERERERGMDDDGRRERESDLYHSDELEKRRRAEGGYCS